MKRILIVFINVIVVTTILAQSPNSFKYQTVVRDAAGEVLSNQDVSFQFSILQGSTTGTSVYTETYDVTTNDFGLVNLNIGAGTTSDDFSTIDWGNGPFFIKVELDKNGGTNFSEMGTSQLLSVPYAMYSKNVEEKQILNFQNDTLYLTDGGQIYLGNYTNLWQQNDTNIYYNNGWVGVGTSTPSGMMVVQGDEGVNPDSAIFEVKNKDGQTIFAVYDGGVRIWVDDTEAKANTDKGGFAVGGYRLNKSITSEYLRVTPDSVRVYIREDDGTKANTDKGGFAVGGYRLNKSTTNQYFNINPNLEADTLNPSEARIYWYPLKEAFMSGRVLVESVDSVGLNSWATGFESKSIGNYSQAMGYRARAKGNNSTAIGYNANADSANSYALGNYALAQDSGSYAIGTGAQATGLRSFAIGSVGFDLYGNPLEPAIARGMYSYAFGAGAVSLGMGSFAIGISDTASGPNSFAFGINTKSDGLFSLTIGYGTYASGESSIAMGNKTNAFGDYSLTMGWKTTTTGNSSLATGSETTSSGSCSTSFGWKTTASGSNSISAGKETNASGSNAISIGNGTTASGENATALGAYTLSSGYASLTSGIGTYASGKYSVAFGENIYSKSYTEVVIGSYNDTILGTNPNSWAATDPVFTVANGYFGNRSNAMIVLKNGNIGMGTNIPVYKLQVNGDVVPNSNKVFDLGADTLAWDDVYYDDLHNQGAAAFTDRKVTDEILLYPPKAKTKGMLDYKTERGLIELDPNSLPNALTGGTFWILTDEMATYNYKANYEQQVQIKKLQEENIAQQKIIKEQQELMNKLIKRIEKLEK